MGRLQTLLAHGLMALGNHGAARRFDALARTPEAAQRERLLRLLAANADTRYGRAHGFGRLRSVEDFQKAVPLADYEAHRPHIEAAMAGEPGVLTAEPVLAFEKTGGSTAAAKYIPFTASLRREFGMATAPWLYDWTRRRPALATRGVYWSVTPLGREREVTPGGLPVGFEDDTAYFGPLERWVLGKVMRVPKAIARLETLDAARYATLRHLLDTDDLGLISVWNPSFLTLLLDALEREGDRLVYDLRHGTLSLDADPALSVGLVARPEAANRLAGLLARGPLFGTEVWPSLKLISAWTDAGASRFLPELARRFPGVEVQGKGLLATEGVVTFPLLDRPGGVLAVGSHFYEFIPESASEGERPLLAHQLEPEGRYSVVITTGGGLYRYPLHDVVEVVGRHHATPLLRFLGKGDKTVDVVGEKLAERHVAAAIEAECQALGLTAPFVMLAPEWGAPPRYALFVQASAGPAAALADRLEARLYENPHYAYARGLGQLGAVVAVPLGPEAAGRYLAGCTALGQRAGDVKPVYLHRDFGWRDRLAPEAAA